MKIIAIDPGYYTGYAIFDDHKTLTNSGLIRATNEKEYIAKLERLASFRGEYSKVVIERPKVWATGRARPNDLIELAVKVGIVTAALSYACAEIVYCSPDEWKGEQKKKVTEKNINLSLSEEELRTLKQRMIQIPASYQNNVYDAIGIGMWYLNRLNKRRVAE